MKPEFKTIKNKDFTVLEVKGDLTIQSSEEFKKQLLQLSQEINHLELSLGSVSDMDVTAIQLVHAFKSLVTLNRKKINITFPSRAEVSELLVTTGLMKMLTNEASTTSEQ